MEELILRARRAQSIGALIYARRASAAEEALRALEAGDLPRFEQAAQRELGLRGGVTAPQLRAIKARSFKEAIRLLESCDAADRRRRTEEADRLLHKMFGRRIA